MGNKRRETECMKLDSKLYKPPGREGGEKGGPSQIRRAKDE